jgi:hypothetical protein
VVRNPNEDANNYDNTFRRVSVASCAFRWNNSTGRQLCQQQSSFRHLSNRIPSPILDITVENSALRRNCKTARFEIFTAVTVKNAVFWYLKTRFLTSKETYCDSATEPSRLMLCKISDFHGGDYQECHLLGYKNPAHTSKETYHISSTEFSQLMICKIWGFHGGDYEECCLLWCYAVWLLQENSSNYKNILKKRTQVYGHVQMSTIM